MASLRDIRKRIKSVKSTRQITRAVKMVAAAKLRRAQDAIISARPYASTLDKMIAEVMSRAGDGNVAHPLLVKREVKKGANRVGETLCTGTKAECAAKKGKHRVEETKDKVVDETKKAVDKVD